MPVITDISPQKKNTNRSNIFLDGEFFCGAENIVIAKNGLRIGGQVNTEMLSEIIFESEKETAFAKAANHLASRRISQKQMNDYLLQKGFSEEVATAVIEKMREYNYINDEEFVAAYLQFNSKDKGKKKIVYELRLKGIGEELLQEIVQNFEDDEDELFALAEKYCKNLEKDFKNKTKIFRYLQSKGYDNEKIYDVIQKLWEN